MLTLRASSGVLAARRTARNFLVEDHWQIVGASFAGRLRLLVLSSIQLFPNCENIGEQPGWGRGHPR